MNTSLLFSRIGAHYVCSFLFLWVFTHTLAVNKETMKEVTTLVVWVLITAILTALNLIRIYEKDKIK